MQTRKHDAAMPYTSEQCDGSFTSETGLTKREFFAAAALQGLLSTNVPLTSPETIAYDAVNCADALIKALNLDKIPEKY